MFHWILAVSLLLSLAVSVATADVSPAAPPVVTLLEGNDQSNWTGLDEAKRFEGDAVYRHPDGARGWYQHGFRTLHDGSGDWRDYWGLQLDVVLIDEQPVTLDCTLSLPPQPARDGLLPSVKATVQLQGKGEHRISLPWSAFDFPQAQPGFLHFIKQVALHGSGPITLRAARVVKAETIALEAAIRGQSVAAGKSAQYTAALSNCTPQPQAVVLQQQTPGWQTMKVSIELASLTLAPGETAEIKVNVAVPDRIPAGGHESQTILAIANGQADAAAKLTFITAVPVDSPSILLTAARWQAVRDKAAKYPWAKKLADEYVAKAQKWNVPQIASAGKNLTGTDDSGAYVFPTTSEHDLMAAAIAYQLTDRKDLAEKVRTWLLRLSDPQAGFPVTLRGCNQSQVQEGHFFQHAAMAYDMTRPAGIYTQADQQQIEHTFRLLMDVMDEATDIGDIGNWNVSEICGALYCALAVGDLERAERFFKGAGGIIDHLAHGVLDDGWWYECSISYNVWCTTEFTQVALAMEPWGYNFRDMNVPVGYSTNYSLRPFDTVNGLYGMSFQKWGPITRNHVNIRRMWDALPPFVDYRGVMFGVNDATERPVGGEAFDIAYSVYGDPVYAAMVKQGDSRDLLYGEPNLPEKTPELFQDSAYADNVGVAMLRSKSAGKPDRERIQAVLHYGTHGGFHGHFDRTNLLHLSRYGRSFYNPEMIWWGYPSFMYKFYVQNSTTKNRVVVDRKMQEPVESDRLLWHTGDLFQATAVQTNARWSTPPYGGMVYPEQGYKTLQDKAWGEGQFLPKPEDEPQ